MFASLLSSALFALTRKATHLSEEEKAAFELYHTAGRQTYLVGHGIFLIFAGSVRLLRVALGVETAAGAYSATQVCIFVCLLLLGLTLVALFTNLTKLKPSPGAVSTACVVTVCSVSGTIQILIASLLSQDEPQPPEVFLFIGGIVTATPMVPHILMLGNRIAMFISVLSYVQTGFFMVFSLDVCIIFMALQFVIYFMCNSTVSQQQESFLHQRNIEGQHCLNLI